MKLKYLVCVLLLITASACKKINNTKVSDFSVKTAALTFKAGDKVDFNFEGSPFQVSFYSGETGSNYMYKDTPKAGSTTIDRSVPIKGYSDVALTSFTYVYSVPGTYRATFVATNKTRYTDEETVKYVDLVIN